MSTDLRAPNNPNPNITDTSDLVEEKKKVFDLSLTQVAGGALAAMTAAALGSTLEAMRRATADGEQTGPP